MSVTRVPLPYGQTPLVPDKPGPHPTPGTVRARLVAEELNADINVIACELADTTARLMAMSHDQLAAWMEELREANRDVLPEKQRSPIGGELRCMIGQCIPRADR
jgi:hypothetical protein